MNKKLFNSILTGLIFSASNLLVAQGLPGVKYWIGNGSDTTYVVIDFQDGTPDSSYVWGYLHDGTHTGEDALNAIWNADINADINIDTLSFGTFLHDATYGRHTGLGGLPDYWGSWDGNHIDSLAANNGIGDTLISGGIVGYSYMDFSPSIPPGKPWAAFDPNAFGFKNISQWYGNGSDSTVLIIDFLDGSDTVSFAWGFLFNDSILDVALLDSLTQYIPGLSATISGGVLNITYNGHSGQVGALTDWYGWTATNHGNWVPHWATPTYVKNGKMAAFVFTQLTILERPNVPVNLDFSIGIPEIATADEIRIYPNPASDYINVDGVFEKIELYNISGALQLSSDDNSLDLRSLKPGVYVVSVTSSNHQSIQRKIVIR